MSKSEPPVFDGDALINNLTDPSEKHKEKLKKLAVGAIGKENMRDSSGKRKVMAKFCSNIGVEEPKKLSDKEKATLANIIISQSERPPHELASFHKDLTNVLSSMSKKDLLKQASRPRGFGIKKLQSVFRGRKPENKRTTEIS